MLLLFETLRLAKFAKLFIGRSNNRESFVEIWSNGIQKHYTHSWILSARFALMLLTLKFQAKACAKLNRRAWIEDSDATKRSGCWFWSLVLVRKHAHWFFDFTNAARKTQAQTKDTLTKGTRSCDSTNVYNGQHALPDASANAHATISWETMWTRNKHTSAGPIARDFWSPGAAKAIL